MGFFDDIVRPIATDVISSFGTSVNVTKVLRAFDKLTLRETLSDSDVAALPATVRPFSVYEAQQSGGKIILGDLRVTIPAESWEAALPADPLPRVLGGEEIRVGIPEGDAAPTSYRCHGLGYGRGQDLVAVYHLHLRRAS